LKQKHRERKPKPGGDGEAGDERDEADEGDDDDDEFDAPTQIVAKKKQLSMQELIAKELGDIQGGL
jgi:hypothetical protein